jgi:hypothetical protein
LANIGIKIETRAEFRQRIMRRLLVVHGNILL